MQKGVLLLISVTSILPHMFSGSYQSAKKHFLFYEYAGNILSSGIFRHFDNNNLPQLGAGSC